MKFTKSQIINMDCLEVMKNVEDESVQIIALPPNMTSLNT